MTTNHKGTTVRFRYPIPKGRNDPSSLYNKTGLIAFTKTNKITNSAIAMVSRFIVGYVILFLIHLAILFIAISSSVVVFCSRIK